MEAMEVKSIELQEVGPREGFQFEGIGQPDKISTQDKLRLVHALAETGLKTIQVTSFVSPRLVPQMADAEILTAGLHPKPGVTYTAIYLNDKGLLRALAQPKYHITGAINLTASQTFSRLNQNRTFEQDVAMQHRQIQVFREQNIPVTEGMIMTAFGCNYEGDIPLSRILSLVETLHDLVNEAGGSLSLLSLADTMGWADPEQIKRTLGAVRSQWPELEISLHLHDTRGTGLANVYAAMEMGVRKFDTSVGGLGGCPFAGVVAGNVATEDVVFMCERMGVATGVNLAALVDCVTLAEEVVGHMLPSKVGHVFKKDQQNRIR